MLISNAWIRTGHAAAGMDAFELFRKLGAGAKFDLKRFGQDAARFKVTLTRLADNIPDKSSEWKQQVEIRCIIFWLTSSVTVHPSVCGSGVTLCVTC